MIWSSLVDRYHRPALFAAWSVTLLNLLLSGKSVVFIIPALNVVLVMGMLIMAAMFFVEMSRPKRRKTDEHDVKDWLNTLILFIPILYISLIGDAGLDSYAFQKRSVGEITKSESLSGRSRSPYQENKNVGADAEASPSSTQNNKPQNSAASGNVTPVNMLWLLQNVEYFTGKRVAVTGMVFHPPDLPKNNFILFRFIVSCCAADAQPVGLIVDFPDNDVFKNDMWVVVDGVLEIDMVKGQKCAVLKTTAVKPTDRPNTPYLQ